MEQHTRRNTVRTFPAAILLMVAMLAMTLPLAGRAAALTPSVAALPTSVVPPPLPGNGVPYADSAGDAQRAGGSLDLAQFGYVEEEFFMSGQANVYHYGATGAAEVKTAGVPYTTRILVRRPTDPQRFSGNVYFETSHPQAGIDFIYSKTVDLIVSRGDAYVSMATRRGSFSAIEIMKSFDPERYAPLQFSEDGLNWDLMSQAGRLLRSPIPANPLNGYEVERVNAVGWSGGGALPLLYISEGFHTNVRMPDGGPVFDAFLVGEPSGYPQISTGIPAIPTSDPRQQVQPIDVPVISLHTRPQEPYRRRADGDAPGDRYRVYEVAGASHSGARYPAIYNQSQEFLDNLHAIIGCGSPASQFPMHMFFKSTLARLDAWAERGVVPPASLRITLNPDGTPKLDAHGNPEGGVRSSYTDVPTARYFANTGSSQGCSTLGAQERFSPEKLASLYRNHGGYVSSVMHSVKELSRAGWLLPADAQELKNEAPHFAGI